MGQGISVERLGMENITAAQYRKDYHGWWTSWHIELFLEMAIGTCGAKGMLRMLIIGFPILGATLVNICFLSIVHTFCSTYFQVSSQQFMNLCPQWTRLKYVRAQIRRATVPERKFMKHLKVQKTNPSLVLPGLWPSNEIHVGSVLFSAAYFWNANTLHISTI